MIGIFLTIICILCTLLCFVVAMSLVFLFTWLIEIVSLTRSITTFGFFLRILFNLFLSCWVIFVDVKLYKLGFYYCKFKQRFVFTQLCITLLVSGISHINYYLAMLLWYCRNSNSILFKTPLRWKKAIVSPKLSNFKSLSLVWYPNATINETINEMRNHEMVE